MSMVRRLTALFVLGLVLSPFLLIGLVASVIAQAVERGWALGFDLIEMLLAWLDDGAVWVETIHGEEVHDPRKAKADE